jgi:hypothetical protein
MEKIIIKLQGPPNAGKTKSIVLAARQRHSSGAILVAKEIRRVDIDCVEIYAVETPKRRSYMAYVSLGDTQELIQKSFDILDTFINVALFQADLVSGMEKIKTKYHEAVINKKCAEIYRNMQDTLMAIGNQFRIDIIVIACHDDSGQEGSTFDAITKYAKAHDYLEEVMIKKSLLIDAPNYIDIIAKDSEASARKINELANTYL